jgi:hypothetical protein
MISPSSNVVITDVTDSNDSDDELDSDYETGSDSEEEPVYDNYGIV